MAVERLGSYYWQTNYNDITYTLLDGVNRLVVVLIGLQDSQEDDVTGVTLNGVALTQAVESNWTADDRKATIFYMLEEDLPADNGDYTISFTVSGTIVRIGVVVRTYQWVKQQAPEDTDSQQLPTEQYPYVDLTSTTGAVVCMASCINNTGIGVDSYEFDTGIEMNIGANTAEVNDVLPVYGEWRRWNINLYSNAYNTITAGASFAPASDEENYPVKVLQVQLGIN